MDAREEGKVKGREEGRDEGREEGVTLGRLLALQEIPGETLAPEEELMQWSISRLSKATVTVQTKLRDRKA